MTNAVPIGAPFLYLPAPRPAPPKHPAGLVAFPFHGWEKGDLPDVERTFREYAETLRALRAEGHSPITVCLYHREHAIEAVRRVFEEQGFPVVTAGPRDDNPGFLPFLRDLILDHATATANRIATGAFYALSLSRPFFRAGPPVGFGEEALRYREFEDREFPMLRKEAFAGRVEKAVGDEELGAEFRLPPETLRELFGWSGRGLLSRGGRAIEIGGVKAARACFRAARRLAGGRRR